MSRMMISDILSLYEFVDKQLEKRSVLSALFTWEGVKKHGDKEVEVERVPSDREEVWFYKVKPYQNFVFVAYPVNPSVHFDFGIASGKNPDSNMFRFVSTPMSMYGGGEANVKVDFMVFGYVPENLLDKNKSK